jgi:hypothetical protein
VAVTLVAQALGRPYASCKNGKYTSFQGARQAIVQETRGRGKEGRGGGALGGHTANEIPIAARSPLLILLVHLRRGHTGLALAPPPDGIALSSLALPIHGGHLAISITAGAAWGGRGHFCGS